MGGVKVTVIVFGWHVVDEGAEGVPLTTQEQADKIFAVTSILELSEHCETMLPGNEAVCVVQAVVYVAQNAVT